MAKRSPILGYNHNVRYRGIVFHVQTEDSGLLSPHLFTHLFHGGVIISTRKLVYDAGAAEDAIKSLMQAQHKAVLKDLKKGSFDDKIDQYLGGTPGLLPRGAEDPGADDSQLRASEPALDTQPTPRFEPATSRQATEADVSAYELASPSAARSARTRTADRGSLPSAVRTNLPPPPPSADELGGPTLNDGDAAGIAAAVAAANATVQRMDDGATIPVAMPAELSPLEIELELDEPEELPQRQRPRDTDIASQGEIDGARRMPGESVPPLPAAPHAHPRASSVGAAALPPKPPPSRLPSRPAISPPQVVSRPIAPRDADTSGAVEVYAPPPPGAELPGERPGQYSQHKRVSQKVPVIESFKDRAASGAAPVPPGLGRPGRTSASPSPPVPPPSSGVPKPVTASSSSQQQQARPATGGNQVVSSGVPQTTRDQASSNTRARTPTPSRLASLPSASRTASSGPTANPNASGVVMTRPAVIVGAPAKPNQPARVRKAREEEGRGFGQGLISEKSLDEVILAYLSEDADEK